MEGLDQLNTATENGMINFSWVHDTANGLLKETRKSKLSHVSIPASRITSDAINATINIFTQNFEITIKMC